MENFYINILPLEQQRLFTILRTQPWLNSFYLAGGTSLALQIGHRISVDFDFFCPNDFSLDFIKQRINEIGLFNSQQEDKNTLHGTINNVKISFLGYKYNLLEPIISQDSFNLAGLKDLACMKLSAIMSRGEKKDFIDFYYLLKYFSLIEMLAFYEQKYNVQKSEYLILKSLVYFADAENDPMPIMSDKKIKWTAVKKEIIKQVKSFKI